MAQKNDTTALVLALLVTLGLLGGGAWLLFGRFSGGLNLGAPDNPVSTQSGSGSGSIVGGSSGGSNGFVENPPAFAATGSRFSDVQGLPTGAFNYGGSTSWAPVRLLVDSQLQAARPEFQLNYANPKSEAAGSGSGIRMVLRGELAFAQSSRPLKPEEQAAAKGLGTSLAEVAVAYDGIAVAVNPGLEVPGLTPEQLMEIYTGQITNWSQVKGPDLAIAPLLRAEGGTTEEVLQGQQPGSNVKRVNSTTEALRALTQTPGGIYFASAPEIVPQCSVKALPMGQNGSSFVPPYQEPLVPAANCPALRNQLNAAVFRDGSYPLTRALYVVIQQNGGPEQQAGESYARLLLTNEGQEALAKAGFVPLR
jgi:phosphate transport system substrate-binding protein